ncbi:MAG: hypothetical protein RIC30_16920 [Marinoscillum sp.]|uniref:hypothetical protein n=1 Tax=Marinoscillum sp. TaxID=2024838 RepID=UPI0032FC78C9
MGTIEDFDRLLLTLQEKIQNNPADRERILLSFLKDTPCPYLQSRLKASALTSSRDS